MSRIVFVTLLQSDAIKVFCNVSRTHTNEHHGHNEGDPFAHVSTFADVHAEEKISDFLKLNLSGRISATNVWRLLVVGIDSGHIGQFIYNYCKNASYYTVT